MDQEDVVCIYNGILLSQKKEQNFAICSNKYGFGSIMLTEIRQTEKEKHCMISHICGI